MPQRPLKPCRLVSCKSLTRNSGYCDEHAELGKAWVTRQGSGRGGRPWRRLRDQVLRRDQYICRCEVCAASKRIREATEVDHIIPLSQGGTDVMSNLRAINVDCHREKTQREAKASSGGKPPK